MARMNLNKLPILPLALAGLGGAAIAYFATRPKMAAPQPQPQPQPPIFPPLPGPFPIPTPPTATGLGSLATVGDDVLVPIQALGVVPPLTLPQRIASVYLTVNDASSPTLLTGVVTGYPTPGAIVPVKTPIPPALPGLPPISLATTAARSAVQQVLRNGVPVVPILGGTGVMNPGIIPVGRERAGAQLAAAARFPAYAMRNVARRPGFPWYPQ